MSTHWLRSEQGAGTPDEELLGNPRPWSRARRLWLIGVAACVVAGVVLAVVHDGHGRPAAGTSAAASVTAAPTTAAESSAAVLAGAPMLAVLTVGQRTWVLQPHYLNVVDDLSVVVRTASIDLDLQQPDARARLLLDPDGSTLWLVLEGVRHSDVLAFDAFTLVRRSGMEFPDISSAAVLDGHLYVISGGSLVDIPQQGSPRLVGTPSNLAQVAADPGRSMLLLIDGGSPTNVSVYRPGVDGTTSSLALPLARGTITVAHGKVWVGGFGNTAPVLVRLNRTASGTAGTSPLTTALHAGALIVATGQRVFWVRDGGGGDDLWCLDADTGKVSQHWTVSGPVSSVAGTAIVGSAGHLEALRLAGCAG